MDHLPMHPVSALFRSLLVLVALAACASQPLGEHDDGTTTVSGSYLQGRFAAQAFDLTEADRAFGFVASKRDALDSQRLAFAYALASGSMEDAETQARLIVGQDMPDLEGFQPGLQADLPRFTLAAAAMREGDTEATLDWLEEPMASPLGKSLAVLLRSSVLLEREGLEAAMAVLAEQDPNTFRGLIPLHAAGLLVLGGDERSAEVAYRQALSAPRSDVAALGFARLMEAQGNDDEASIIYVRMLQDAGLYSRAGRMGLVRMGRREGQPKVFTRRAEAQPPLLTDAKSLFALAIVNFAWLGFEQAVGLESDGPAGELGQRQALVVPLALANISRAMDPKRDAADYVATLIFSFYGDSEAAAAAASDIRPESWLHTFAVLETAAAVGRDTLDAKPGIKIIRDAAKADGGVNPAWALQLQILYSADEQYDEAERYAAEALAVADAFQVLPSSRWRYYFARGISRQEAGNWDGAKNDLEQALELAPAEVLVLNHLGYSYVERGEQLERAFGMIEQALAQDPENGAIVDSLGWAHFQQGRYNEAVVYLEQAVGLEPEDAVITDHLGDAYFMLGRDREAQYEWKRVPDMDDAQDELKATIARKLAGDFAGLPVLETRSVQP